MAVIEDVVALMQSKPNPADVPTGGSSESCQSRRSNSYSLVR
jgi:hypothetical protein